MKPTADQLLEQITQSQSIARTILKLSGLDCAGVVYAFATLDTLVINCNDEITTCLLDEGQLKLRQVIVELEYPIHNIVIEQSGETVSHWW
jgi:hypothetical protein